MNKLMKRQLIVILTGLLVLTACAQEKSTDYIFPIVKYTKTDSKKDFIVTIRTSLGDMKVILYDETPLHKENFLELAKTGQYDSTIWHRVIKEFMVQGGGIDMVKGVNKTEKIPAEFDDRLFHVKGALAAARQGDNVNPEKASSWCQFYIVQGKTWKEEDLTIDQEKLQSGVRQLIQMPKYNVLLEQIQELQTQRKYDELKALILKQAPVCEQELGLSVKKDMPANQIEAYQKIGGSPHLDEAYTVFGHVVEGLEVVDKIANAQLRGSKPIQDIYITMEVEELSKKKIAKLYGVQYPGK